MAKRSKYWIQKAIKHPGALKRWIKKHRTKIRRLTGIDPIKRDGDISITALKRLRKTQWYKRLSETTKHRINLAITLYKLHKKKR